MSICVNSIAQIIIDHETGEEKRVGSQTECGLLEFARRNNFNYT